MEPIRSKRRSFSKSKLVMSIYRAAKPSSAALVQPYSSKPPKPSPSNNPSPTSLEFVVNQPIKSRPSPPPPSAGGSAPVGLIIVNQDQAFPQQTPKVAFVYPDNMKRDSTYGKLENFYEDEAVDAKAASYISSVREKFRQNFEDNNIHI